jgi:uncharacterized membrane protein
MGRFFWAVMACTGAVLVHIGFVLYGPSKLFQTYASFDKAIATSNTLVVLPDIARRSLLPSLRGPGVAAYCDIDLSKGPVTIALRPPKTYWSLAVFGQNGRQVYALNERQADAEDIAIDFKRAPSLIEQISGGGEDDTVSIIQGAAWTVQLKDRHAYAVLWIPYADPLLIADGERALKSGRCSLTEKKV